MGSPAWRMYKLTLDRLKMYRAQGKIPFCEGIFGRGIAPHEIQVGERYWGHTTAREGRRTKYYCYEHYRILNVMGPIPE